MGFLNFDHTKLNTKSDDHTGEYVVGIDLRNDVTQISYFAIGSAVPETVSMTVGEEDYTIPTVLCRRYEVNQWYFGRQAVDKAGNRDGILIKDIMRRAGLNEKVGIEGDEYYAVDLLALFVKRCFTLLPPMVSKNKIMAVVITVEKLDKGMMNALGRTADTLGIPKERIFYNTCAESFYCYMVHQDRQLWEHETLLLDFTKEGIHAYRMVLNHKTRPVVVMVEEKEYRDFIVYNESEASALKEGRIEVNRPPSVLDRDFFRIAKEQCEGHIVDAVYIVGNGFSQDWSKESIAYLCKNRKVYQGSNLMSKGAAFAAMDRYLPESVHKEFVYLGGDKLRANLGMHVIRKGGEAYMALLDAGANWYETSKDVELLLDGGIRPEVIITPMNGGKVITKEIELEDYPLRSGKTNRIHLHAEPISPQAVKLEISDMGFGEIFPSSGKTWTKEIELCE